MNKSILLLSCLLLLASCETPSRPQESAESKSVQEDELTLKERKARVFEARNQIESQKIWQRENDSHKSSYQIHW